MGRDAWQPGEHGTDRSGQLADVASGRILAMDNDICACAALCADA